MSTFRAFRSRSLQILETHPFMGGLALCLLVVLARGLTRLTNADFWAEDGRDLVHDALQLGGSSLWLPLDGYYHFLQRGIVLFWLSIAPLRWLAALVCGTCFLIYALAAATITRREFEWLLPYRSRLAIAFLFSLAPGLAEMLGNLCNLHWIFVFWAGVLSLKCPQSKFSLGELFFFAFVFFSSGTAVLLLPVFLVRTGHAIWHKEAQWKNESIPLITLVVATVCLALTPKATPSVLPSLRDSIPFLVRLYYRNLFLRPWAGEPLTIQLVDSANSFWEGIFRIAFIVIFFRIARKHYRTLGFWLVTILAFSLPTWPLLLIIARCNGIVGWPAFEIDSNETFLHRYSFFGGVMSVLLWLFYLGREKFYENHRWSLAGVFLAVNFFSSLYRFQIRPYGPVRLWSSAAPLIESAMKTGCPHEVRVRNYPVNWASTYVAPHPAAECKVPKVSN